MAYQSRNDPRRKDWGLTRANGKELPKKEEKPKSDFDPSKFLQDAFTRGVNKVTEAGKKVNQAVSDYMDNGTRSKRLDNGTTIKNRRPYSNGESKKVTASDNKLQNEVRTVGSNRKVSDKQRQNQQQREQANKEYYTNKKNQQAQAKAQREQANKEYYANKKKQQEEAKERNRRAALEKKKGGKKASTEQAFVNAFGNRKAR